MAEAALSGGSGEAGAAAPVASPNPGQAPSGKGAPGSVQPAPIPPKGPSRNKVARPSLPGVISNEVGADEIPDLFSSSKLRNERGQFVKQGEAPVSATSNQNEEGGAPGEVTKPELPKVEGEEPPPVAKKIKFAGKEYDDLAKAEQAHKTLQGMYKPLQEERDYGFQAAHAWKAHAEKVSADKDAEIAELKKQLGRGGVGATGQPGNGTGTAGAPAETGLPDVEAILNDVDTDAFESLALSHGLPMAGKYLVGETIKTVLSKIVPAIKAEFQSSLAPFQAQAATSKAAQEADNVINSVASLRAPDGQIAFPELSDAVTVVEIGKCWRESGLPIEHALTPNGLINAIALYRTMKGFAAPPPTPEVEAPVAPPVPGPAASVSVDSRTLPPNSGRTNLSPELQRFMNGFSKTDVIDRDLGFARNRR